MPKSPIALIFSILNFQIILKESMRFSWLAKGKPMYNFKEFYVLTTNSSN